MIVIAPSALMAIAAAVRLVATRPDIRIG